MLGWLLNIAYACGLLLVAPILIWRRWRHGRYRRGWREKLWGALPVRTDHSRPLVWLHAVSVGEVILLAPLIRALRDRHGDLQCLVTTSTDSGYDVARARLPDCTLTWLPLDFTWAVRTALRRVRPDLLVLAELELWPNLIREADQQRVPLALINARLSERSLKGYSRLPWLFTHLLPRFRLIAAQTETYAQRFRQLGAKPDAVTVTGSIKFDGVQADRGNPQTTQLRALLGIKPEELVLIAGSTQSPEELEIAVAWEQLRQQHPRLRLVLVPRHRERFDEVAAMLAGRGHRILRRSAVELSSPRTSSSPPPVILVDTIGELGAVWGLADVAYVGGSLTPGRGGQNMLEPAAYGAAVVVGPHTENFRQIVATLREANAIITAADPVLLGTELANLCASTERRNQLGSAARRVVLSQQGATERTAALLLPRQQSTDVRPIRAA